MRYLPEEGRQALIWQEGGGSTFGLIYSGSVGGGGGQLSVKEWGSEVWRPPTLALPGPLASRPSLGARLVVQSNLGRTVYPLVSEMTQAWQEEPRRGNFLSSLSSSS